MTQPDTNTVAVSDVVDAAIGIALSSSAAHIRERAILTMQVRQYTELVEQLNQELQDTRNEINRLLSMATQTGETVIEGVVVEPTTQP